MTKSELDALINRITTELIDKHKEDVEEATSSANVAGYNTPGAFSKRGFGKKKKGIMGNYTSNEGGHKNPAILGYTLVESEIKVAKLIGELKESEKPAFKEFFKGAMEKFSITSPKDLQNEDERQSFFDYVDRNFKAQNEGKKFYDDKSKWEKSRNKLNVADDSETSSKDESGKIIAMWNNDRSEGWVTESATYQMMSKGLSKWYEYSKEDLMSFIYWTKGQIPPVNNSAYDKNWKSIVGQLQKKYPAAPKLYNAKLKESMTSDQFDSAVKQVKKLDKVVNDYVSKNYKAITSSGKFLSQKIIDGIVKLSNNNQDKKLQTLVSSLIKSRETLRVGVFESVNETKFYAWYNKKKIEINGTSLYDAKKKAIAQFKVPKSKENQIAIKSQGSMDAEDFRFETVNEASKMKLSAFVDMLKMRLKQSSDAAFKTKYKSLISQLERMIQQKGDISFDPEDFARHVGVEESVLNEAGGDKLYFEKVRSQYIQLWRAYAQGSGTTLQITHPMYITDKSGEKNYDRNTSAIIDLARKNYRTIRKAQNTTLHKIPVYTYERPSGVGEEGRYDIHGMGSVKPTGYQYMATSSGNVKVVTFFQNQREALNWMKSMVKEAVSDRGQPIKYKGKDYYIGSTKGNKQVFVYHDKNTEYPVKINGKHLMVKVADIEDKFKKESVNEAKFYVWYHGANKTIYSTDKAGAEAKARKQFKFQDGATIHINSEDEGPLGENIVEGKSRDKIIALLVKDHGKKAASYNNNEKTKSNEKFWTLNRLTNHYHDLNAKKETGRKHPMGEAMNEVLGYRLSAMDKYIIEQFVKGYFDEVKQAVTRSKQFSIRSGSNKHVLSGYSPYAAWINGKLLVGDTFGNVSQTVQNYIIKVAKKNGIPYKLDSSVQSESITESKMGELDTMARMAKDFKAFASDALRQHPQLDKDTKTMAWLKKLYDQAKTNESVNENKQNIFVYRSKINPDHYSVIVSPYDTLGLGGQQLKNKMSEKEASAFAKKYAKRWGFPIINVSESINEAGMAFKNTHKVGMSWYSREKKNLKAKGYKVSHLASSGPEDSSVDLIYNKGKHVATMNMSQGLLYTDAELKAIEKVTFESINEAYGNDNQMKKLIAIATNKAFMNKSSEKEFITKVQSATDSYFRGTHDLGALSQIYKDAKKGNWTYKNSEYNLEESLNEKKSPADQFKRQIDNAYDSKDFKKFVPKLKKFVSKAGWNDITGELKAIGYMESDLADQGEFGDEQGNDRMQIENDVEDLKLTINFYLNKFNESVNETNTSINPSTDRVKYAIEKALDGGKVVFHVKGVGKVEIDDLKAKMVSGIEKIVFESKSMDHFNKLIKKLKDGNIEGDASRFLKDLMAIKPRLQSLEKAGILGTFKYDAAMAEGRNGKYWQLSKDETLTTRQKMGIGIRKMNEMLRQIETLVNMHARLKTETDFDSQTYWKRAQKAMIKIENRLVRISNTIRQLK